MPSPTLPLGRLEPRRRQALLAQLPEAAAPLRRQPVRLAFGEVDVADEPADERRALDDELDRLPHRLCLVEPRERRAEERHLGPAVGDDDDARRLLGEPLTDDELVALAGRRKARGGSPVDGVDVVSLLVRA